MPGPAFPVLVRGDQFVDQAIISIRVEFVVLENIVVPTVGILRCRGQADEVQVESAYQGISLGAWRGCESLPLLVGENKEVNLVVRPVGFLYPWKRRPG